MPEINVRLHLGVDYHPTSTPASISLVGTHRIKPAVQSHRFIPFISSPRLATAACSLRCYRDNGKIKSNGSSVAESVAFEAGGAGFDSDPIAESLNRFKPFVARHVKPDPEMDATNADPIQKQALMKCSSQILELCGENLDADFEKMLLEIKPGSIIVILRANKKLYRGILEKRPPEQSRGQQRRRESAGECPPLAQPYAAEPSACGPLYSPHSHCVRYQPHSGHGGAYSAYYTHR
ncbi:hypothetical protein EVAR_35888_1 [Eumeta japonica]|uniref:Uncharacterized protein n=1 Tax=Eumeta variegata TaxID=151549 RepID=A0A4C1WT03_EUMVA|nr:hypothetical protein EVAR_35888_1 [Eumeta japonica]